MKRYTLQEKQSIISEHIAGTPISALAEKYHVSPSTLYLWVKEFKPRSADAGYSVKELRDLRRKTERQAAIIEILQSVDCHVSSSLKTNLSELSKLYGRYNNHVLCDALKVDRGTSLNYI